MKLPWHWSPGAGGLVALVPVSALDAWGQGDAALDIVVPPDAALVRPLHLTALASLSMAPLIGRLDPAVVMAQLPRLDLPAFEPAVYVARRGPHPTKDLPDVVRSRHTGFLAVDAAGQLHCRAVLQAVVAWIDHASQAVGGPAFPHPEPNRFFHLSVWNNRNGEGWRSIGDIQATDRGL
jgi:hypothetical protein